MHLLFLFPSNPPSVVCVGRNPTPKPKTQYQMFWMHFHRYKCAVAPYGFWLSTSGELAKLEWIGSAGSKQIVPSRWHSSSSRFLPVFNSFELIRDEIAIPMDVGERNNDESFHVNDILAVIFFWWCGAISFTIVVWLTRHWPNMFFQIFQFDVLFYFALRAHPSDHLNFVIPERNRKDLDDSYLFPVKVDCVEWNDLTSFQRINRIE